MDDQSKPKWFDKISELLDQRIDDLKRMLDDLEERKKRDLLDGINSMKEFGSFKRLSMENSLEEIEAEYVKILERKKKIQVQAELLSSILLYTGKLLNEITKPKHKSEREELMDRFEFYQEIFQKGSDHQHRNTSTNDILGEMIKTKPELIFYFADVLFEMKKYVSNKDHFQ